MDLSTTYLGLKLNSPFISGSSPLANDLDKARRLEDAGAAAIVMSSLFQEQLEPRGDKPPVANAAQEVSFLPKACEFKVTPDGYFEQIRRLKAALKIPVIASLNGATPAGWVKAAQLIEQAGADALELNIYYLGSNPSEDGAAVERRVLDVVRAVKGSTKIPLAVKLLPFFSSLAHLASQLDEAGAAGLVLFNRVYQPELDAELLEFATTPLQYTEPAELSLRLHWLALLSGRTRATLAASGGVYTALDAAKAIMAGAHAVQMVSVLLKKGPEYLRQLRQEMLQWMEAHKYASVRQMRGCMNLHRCPDPGAFARTSYMRILQGWR